MDKKREIFKNFAFFYKVAESLLFKGIPTIKTLILQKAFFYFFKNLL